MLIVTYDVFNFSGSNYNGTQICSSGFEIPISYLCDGYDDCGNGEDEKHNLCIG